jgi:site-specific DNA-methyltransferase (adenine-specific)
MKPLALVEQCLAISTRPGDLVVDPFCGSGTTVVAALKLGRRAVGIDSDPASIQLSQRRIDALVE